MIELKNITKVYPGNPPYEVLKSIDLKVDKGEFVSIMGPSGSGKTTLLNIVATLDNPTGGQISLMGQDVTKMKESDLTKIRLNKIGFVFQDFNLLPPLTVIENIMLPLTLNDASPKQAKKKALSLMHELGIEKLENKRIFEISGGEKQRVAIARALVNNPEIILADEPTGNLDSKAAGDVMTILKELNRTKKVTTIMVTHDAISASYSEHVIFIKDGTFYNEIHYGSNREVFYQSILDVLGHLGGTNHEFQTTRYS